MTWPCYHTQEIGSKRCCRCSHPQPTRYILLARLGESAHDRSSVEVKTSTRGVDIAAKAYAGSDIGEVQDAAVDAYFGAMADIQARLSPAAST